MLWDGKNIFIYLFPFADGEVKKKTGDLRDVAGRDGIKDPGLSHSSLHSSTVNQKQIQGKELFFENGTTLWILQLSQTCKI